MSDSPSPTFQAAQQALENLRGDTETGPRPDSLTLLRLYALFKQATLGNAPDERPGIANIKARFKHDAWASLKDMRQGDAETQYILLANTILDRAS